MEGDPVSDKGGMAVFVGRAKRFSGATVVDHGDRVDVMKLGKVLTSFSVVEKVTAEGSRVTAWDVLGSDGGVERLAAVSGCGCGGLPPYTASESYSGRIGR